MKAPHKRKTNASTRSILSDVVRFTSRQFLLATIFFPSEYQSVNLNDVVAASKYAENSKSPAL